MRKDRFEILNNLVDPMFETSIFEPSFFNPFKVNQLPTNIMKTDITEKDSEYVIEIDIPGVDKEDLSITLSDGYLKVEATKETKTEDKDEKDGKYLRQERYYGSQSRSFYVGDLISEEDIKASFDKGVLTVTVPKKEPPKPDEKKIAID